jgi:hypothetical protein
MVTKESEFLMVKMPRADKLALEQMAKSEGETMSVVVRRILRKELRKNETELGVTVKGVGGK